jgi:iron-sulfur cluster assembly protein
MAITLTESAAKYVASQLASRGKGLGIRVGITTTGCSGMAYVLEFVDELNPADQVFEDHGVKIIVDPKSLVYIDGTEMDFVKVGVNEGFEFNNPNAKGECGCGESFSV